MRISWPALRLVFERSVCEKRKYASKAFEIRRLIALHLQSPCVFRVRSVIPLCANGVDYFNWIVTAVVAGVFVVGQQN